MGDPASGFDLSVDASESEIRFLRVQASVSAWSLSASVQELVSRYNTTGDDIAAAEFSLLRAKYVAALIEYVNRFWIVVVGSSKTILVERCATDTSDYVMRQKCSFRDAHANKLVSLWTLNPRRGSISLSTHALTELWMKAPNRRSCLGIVFEPAVDPRESSGALSSTSGGTSAASARVEGARATDFNLWVGFDVRRTVQSPLSMHLHGSASEAAAAVAPFLAHVRAVWCGDDEALYAYCMHWMASVLQRPWQKLGVALVVQGEEGSGKGIVVTSFLAPIIGRRHYSHVTGLDAICGPFNAPALATACLVFVDEVSCVGNKHASARLKTLITEPLHTITNKYVPAVSVKSYANFILSSNDEHVLTMDRKSRRYCVMQTNNQFSGSQTEEKKRYFDQLRAVPVGVVAEYLYALSLDGFNPQAVPTSDMQRRQKRLSMETSCVDLWWLCRLEDHQLPTSADDRVDDAPHGAGAAAWQLARSKTAVYEHYRTNAGSQPKTVETFWKKMSEMTKYRTLQKHTRGGTNGRQLVQFQSLELCQQAFRVHMGDAAWSFEKAAGTGAEEPDEHSEAAEIEARAPIEFYMFDAPPRL